MELSYFDKVHGFVSFTVSAAMHFDACLGKQLFSPSGFSVTISQNLVNWWDSLLEVRIKIALSFEEPKIFCK